MSFEIKLLALPLQASAFLGHIERGVPKSRADQFAGLSVKLPNDESPAVLTGRASTCARTKLLRNSRCADRRVACHIAVAGH